jgi:hypothetical protein
LLALCASALAAAGLRPAEARAGEATPARADLVGLNGNAFPWEPRWGEFQGLFAGSHAGWARVQLSFNSIRPAPDTWQWAALDELVDGYASLGARQLGLLAYSAGWANGQAGSGAVFAPPANLDAWEEYVRETVRRYHDRIEAWEVWNEPDVAMFWGGRDGGDPAAYLELLKRAHRAIKSVDPDAIVMNGGLTGTERGASYLHRLLDLGGGAYLDAVAFHGYVSNDGLDTPVYPEIIWPLVRQARERAGKPLWITEFGWSSGCGDNAAACTEAVQANRIARHLPMLFALGAVEHVFVFLFKDPGNQPNFFGLAHADARAKPAYAAIATITGRLAGLRFVQRVDHGDPGIWAMRFTGADRTVDIIWSQTGEREIFYATGRPVVRTWNMDGGRTDYATSGGGVRLRVGIDPLVVERDGPATSPADAGRCRSFPETGQTVCDGFLDFWERYGGLSIFGYPLSGELREGGKVVQYFERAKLEYQPEAFGTDWAVVGELVGRTITAGREHEPAFRPVPHVTNDARCDAFPETGHRLCMGFRTYWQQHGGLWMFGYPISEEFEERNPDTGAVYWVQYFERARFEWHPENEGTPYAVLLGRLGAQLYAERY